MFSHSLFVHFCSFSLSSFFFIHPKGHTFLLSLSHTNILENMSSLSLFVQSCSFLLSFIHPKGHTFLLHLFLSLSLSLALSLTHTPISIEMNLHSRASVMFGSLGNFSREKMVDFRMERAEFWVPPR